MATTLRWSQTFFFGSQGLCCPHFRAELRRDPRTMCPYVPRHALTQKASAGCQKTSGVVLRTYGKSGSREIRPAAAFPGLFRGKSSMSVAAIVHRPFRLRIQKSSFISPSRGGRGNFKIRNAQYFLYFLISLSPSFLPHHFSGNRLSLRWRSAKLIKLRRERRKWRATVQRPRERRRQTEREEMLSHSNFCGTEGWMMR